MLVLAVTSLAVGLLWIVIGVLLARAKNWKPNSLVGYRTAKSMSSQELWIKANRFSGQCLAVTGLVLAVFGILSFGVEEKNRTLMFFIFVGLLLIPPAISILLTEWHLRRSSRQEERLN
jgi:uncharacterized membrane protein